ncbi:type I phosphodiesterase/nucleotide pyrophosphatase [Paenibacillus larvae subsp. larvae]|nr:type I phosphodiesterase/nucleotide pyrophosphatase [Paenibacillus larvae subsp. larvae]AVG11314.1 type I phosphodiesterase/nucleotide pyrophosphatase [Paenibacillus larvae subsp. larvae DSM 25430]
MAPFIFWNLAFYTIIRTQLSDGNLHYKIDLCFYFNLNGRMKNVKNKCSRNGNLIYKMDVKACFLFDTLQKSC